MSNEKRKYELKARAESQRQTRERIVRATMERHREVGPAQTTVAEIARRAGGQAHSLTLHPLPDLAAALTLEDPIERLEVVLSGQYGWYRETEAMAEKVQRDRAAVPELDELLRRTADAGAAQLADALAAGFPGR